MAQGPRMVNVIAHAEVRQAYILAVQGYPRSGLHADYLTQKDQ